MSNSLIKLFSLFSCVAVLACGSAYGQTSSLNPAVTDAPPVSGLMPDHATLSVGNLDLVADWYERVLGFRPVPETKPNPNPDMIHERLTIPGYEIHLIKYKGSKHPVSVEPIYLQQGWIHVVFHVDDIGAAIKQLQALHVTPKEVKSENGIPARILLRDPENNEIEILPKP